MLTAKQHAGQRNEPCSVERGLVHQCELLPPGCFQQACLLCRQSCCGVYSATTPSATSVSARHLEIRRSASFASRCSINERISRARTRSSFSHGYRAGCRRTRASTSRAPSESPLRRSPYARASCMRTLSAPPGGSTTGSSLSPVTRSRAASSTASCEVAAAGSKLWEESPNRSQVEHACRNDQGHLHGPEIKGRSVGW